MPNDNNNTVSLEEPAAFSGRLVTVRDLLTGTPEVHKSQLELAFILHKPEWGTQSVLAVDALHEFLQFTDKHVLEITEEDFVKYYEYRKDFALPNMMQIDTAFIRELILMVRTLDDISSMLYEDLLARREQLHQRVFRAPI